MIKRLLYEDKIEQMLWVKMIKVILGQRRVGKSTLLQSIISRFTHEWAIYINKELKERSYIRDDNDLYHYLKSTISVNTRILAIDEIQIIVHRELALLSIYNEFPNLEIRITWSNSDMLSTDLTTRLRWRYISLMVYPFVFSEYCTYFSRENNHDSLLWFIKSWTLPSCYELESLWIQYKKDLISLILLRDIIERYSIKDPLLLEDIFVFLVNNSGNITNIWSIESYLQSIKRSYSVNTVQNYISYLRNVFLVYEVPLYDIQWKRVFERLRKYYVSDFSLRRAYFGTYDEWFGKVIEHMVYLTALAYGYLVFVWRIWAYEIDFVCEKDGQKKYLQVCYSLSDADVIKREFGNLEHIDDNYEKRVITMDQIDFWNRNGIKHCFLQDIESRVLS